ncbi:WecB/TagA/CpsF family glycosyltransferase [Desulfurivibrio alkaliphilus]|uniref:Glycosyl transferase, WecB/TagA/CpsF family n=1 Tax=Desulfurivibrio alkaliphilus (strain DSM 19089 / UNIQEM U267 / AHT2) TaxID=589865 RepID=D6Z4J2_DESAT|nr:WecB/TagA/CpsF family glycosyltransferase [Desulfurivibrio alkaliphilus]ADH86467.1 glycosyl transferase, WecB/TagA/CpsF family [Desulfurivibrio alkaliphilus AHT 2]
MKLHDSRKDEVDRDLRREVFCLFGLPVDNLTLVATKELLRANARGEGNNVLSTINVNWVAQAWCDPQFRAAVLNSDTVTLDGKPLLWLARLLGYPISELVPGSTLIQELNQEANPAQPLTIFFFGGEDEAGRQAVAKVNARRGGLRAVGFLNPGFGSVEQMSSEEIINTINQAKPDILLVALGAQKGTRWIEHNRHRLRAKTISHLGATVNFLAGTVQRAPKLVSRMGLEWVWRILQEPKLFSRYAADGLLLLRALAGRLPGWLRYRAWEKRFRRQPADHQAQIKENDTTITLTLGRNLRLTPDSPLRELCSRAVQSGKDLTLDFRQTEFADGAFMALLLILARQQQKQNRQLQLTNIHGRLAQICRFFEIQAQPAGRE